MKKQFVVALATGIFFAGMTGMANAAYVQERNFVDSTDPDYFGLTGGAYMLGMDQIREWTHTYDFSEPMPLFSKPTLTIVADDVDGPSLSNTTGEIIVISMLVNDEWKKLESLETGMKRLDMGTEYSNWNYKSGPGAWNGEFVDGVQLFNTANYTTTDFALELAWLQPVMKFKAEMYGGNWGAEIETSTLTVQGSPVPVPATAILFGAGLAGLAGIVRRKKGSAA